MKKTKALFPLGKPRSSEAAMSFENKTSGKVPNWPTFPWDVTIVGDPGAKCDYSQEPDGTVEPEAEDFTEAESDNKLVEEEGEAYENFDEILHSSRSALTAQQEDADRSLRGLIDMAKALYESEADLKGRVSLYHVMKANMEALGRPPLHRLIYFGKHKFGDNYIRLVKIFEDYIELLNQIYDPDSDLITGFLLCYSTYFIHIVEGTERLIGKHVMHFVELLKKKQKKNFGKIKLMILAQHIKERLFYTWTGRFAKPPTLAVSPDEATDSSVEVSLIKSCVNKLKGLALLLQNQSASFLPYLMDNLSERAKNHLPEVALLDSIFKLKVLIELKDYERIYLLMPTAHNNDEVTWPAPLEFIPYNFWDEPNFPVYKIDSVILDEEKKKQKKEYDELLQEVTHLYEEGIISDIDVFLKESTSSEDKTFATKANA